MDREDRQRHAEIERQTIEKKFGPTDDWPVQDVPKEVGDLYERAQQAIRDYREASLAATTSGYALDSIKDMINNAESYLEESFGFIGD